MARNGMPFKTGSGLLPKVIGFAVLAAVLMLVIKHPTDAADWVRGIGHVVGSTLDGLSTFFQRLAAG